MEKQRPQMQSLEFKHHFFGVVKVTTSIGKDIYAERDIKRASLDAEYKEYRRRGLVR